MSETSTPGKTQSTEAKAPVLSGVATFDQLRAKPRRVLKFDVNTVDEDGEDISLSMKYRALSSKEYDKLLEKHPPSTREKAKGATYTVDTFAPALISAVSAEPQLTVEQATELYNSDEWSGGEISTLFVNALRICNAGLDVPFNGRD